MRFFLIILLTLFIKFTSAQISADFSVNKNSGCSPLSVQFSDQSTGSPTSYYWDFGNGNTSILKNPQMTFINPGTYAITLTVSNASGSDTRYKKAYITVFKNPVADLNADKTTACTSTSIQFYDMSQAGDASISDWYWSFGDGNSSKTQDPVYQYSASGYYTVTLVVTDQNGCTHSIDKTNYIEINAPTADFSANKTTFCGKPAMVIFSDNSSPSTGSFIYNWDFGDGTTSAQKNPTKTYTSTGSYDVKLKIMDKNGCTAETTKSNYIKLLDLSPGFTPNIIDSCEPGMVEFINKSTPSSGLGYSWTFGDGNSSTSKNPVHQYTDAGTYNVTLSISSSGCSNSTSKSIKIYSMPTVDILADPKQHCKVPFQVTFIAQSSGYNKYQWDFGNGTTSSNKTEIVTYNNYGSYTVKLKATNNNGCTKTYEKKSFIISKPLEFSYELNPRYGCKPLSVNYQLYDSSIVPVTDWVVCSGDGDTLKKQNGTFIYEDTGTFYITFTGKNASGCIETLIDTILVGTPPVADFEALYYSGCNDSFIQFINKTNLHNPKTDTFKWDFGDSFYSPFEHPKHKFQDTGYLTVQLIAVYNGCPDTFERENIIYIHTPVANLKLIPSDVCLGDTFKFSRINATVGGHLWYWDFGDQKYDTSKNPKHVYQAPGTYKVMMKVTDTNTQCTDYDSVYITVWPRPETDFTADQQVGCEQMQVSFTDTSTQTLYYYWDFGNGNTSNLKSPVAEYKNGGLYDVKLTISIPTGGCNATIEKKQYIYVSEIQPKFTVTPDQGCIPLEVTLKNQSTSVFPIKESLWEMGNGYSFSTSLNEATYTYKSIEAGKDQEDGYTITLVVKDTNNCSQSIEKIIYPSKPKAYIKTQSNTPCVGGDIKFSTYINDTTINKKAIISWYFNDSLVSNKVYFTKHLPEDTNITVSLILEDISGCKDTALYSYNSSEMSINADFSYQINSTADHCPPVIVQFQNKSKPGKYPITEYSWDFGDGNTSKSESPSNIYSYPGLYSITLMVEDSAGCTNYLSMNDLIQVNGSTGYITAKPLNGCDSVSCTFEAHTTNSVSYTWYFGDGYTNKDSHTVHTYNYPNTFHPLLIVTDSFGCESSITSSDSVVVYQSPRVDFSISKPAVCNGQYVHFYNETTHDKNIITWVWTFGNGDSSKYFEPDYFYTDTGSYTIGLLAIDSAGCRDSILKPDLITVYHDSIPPHDPYLYRITHVKDPALDQIEFTPNQDQDFLYFKLTSTDQYQNEYTLRHIAHYNDTIVTDTLRPLLNPQCYYLQTYDICENKSNSSRLHCLIYLNAQGLSHGNQLDWTPYYGWDSVLHYKIYRMDASSTDQFSLMATRNGNTYTYLDTNLICNHAYYYRIEAREANGYGKTSLSNTDTAIARMNYAIEAVKLIRVSVEDQNILLEWEELPHPVKYSYEIWRSTNNKRYNLIAQVDSKTFSYTDEEANVNSQSYYYKVNLLQASCSIRGKSSNIGRSILLQTGKTSDPETFSLHWNDYVYWEDGVASYDISYLQPSGLNSTIASIKNDSNTYQHMIDPFISEHCYQITAVQNNHENIVSHSNVACEAIEPSVFIPNSFTPNKDGLNDIFKAISYGCRITKLQIFNRWGEMIFETNDHDSGWDGTFENKDCPSGVYYYQVFTKNNTKNDFISGTVTLLR